MDDDEQKPRDPMPSRKERARQMRRAAYERAKEFRATDPKQVAFKEAMKQRRRDANQAAREQRKAATRAAKAGARETARERAASSVRRPPDDSDASDRTALERRLLLKIVPASKLE
jgi:hypothetical protein